MHILIIPSWYPKKPDDISGSFFREQALALRKYGHKIGVIYPQLRSMRDWRSIGGTPKGRTIENDTGIPTFRQHGMAWFPNRLPYASSWLWVWQGLKIFDFYIKQHGLPYIVHAHSLLNGGLLANTIFHRFNIPFVVTEHSTDYGSGFIRTWQKKLAAEAAHNASARLAVSEPLAKLMSLFFDSQDNWQFVPNILSGRFENASFLSNSQQKSAFTFCNVSLLTAKKNISLLIKGFAAAFAGQNDVFLNIAGDGEEREHLEALANSLKLGEQVKFFGMLNREQVVELMVRSNAYALSSDIETFGVVLIESLALGKPVIATQCGGPESIVRKQDGFLIAKKDVTAMATAMKQMREHYCQFDHAEIRQSCLDRFSEKVVISQLVDIYNLVLSGKTS